MQVSKRMVAKSIWDKWWNVVVDSFGRQKPNEIALLLNLILAKEEKVMAVKRLIISYLLINKTNPYDIAKLACVSVATVYKYQQIVTENPEYKKLLSSFKPKISSQPTQTNSIDSLIEAIIKGRSKRHLLNKIINNNN